MTKSIITPKEAEELKKLRAKLPQAQQRVVNALRTSGKPLEGKALDRLLAAENNEATIRRQIKKILGV